MLPPNPFGLLPAATVVILSTAFDFTRAVIALLAMLTLSLLILNCAIPPVCEPNLLIVGILMTVIWTMLQNESWKVPNQRVFGPLHDYLPNQDGDEGRDGTRDEDEP